MTRSAPDACRTVPYAHRTAPGHAVTGKHPTTGPSPRRVAVRNPMRPPPCAPYRTVVRYTIPPLGIPPFPFRHRTTVRYASPWGSLLRFGTVPHTPRRCGSPESPAVPCRSPPRDGVHRHETPSAAALRRSPSCNGTHHHAATFAVARHHPPPCGDVAYDIHHHAATSAAAPRHPSSHDDGAGTCKPSRQQCRMRHMPVDTPDTGPVPGWLRAGAAYPRIRSMRPAYDRLREPVSGMTARHRRRDRLTRSASRRRRCRPCRPASAGTGPSSTCRS